MENQSKQNKLIQKKFLDFIFNNAERNTRIGIRNAEEEAKEESRRINLSKPSSVEEQIFLRLNKA